MALFPAVDRDGLRGGALWHDAVMASSQRVLIEILRWACACGATALNYVEGTGLLLRGGRVTGLRARDQETGTPLAFEAPVVVNGAGPWCRRWAGRVDRDIPELFHPSLAFNLLLDREPLARCAVAVAPPRPGARTYFTRPWKNRLLAGTCHAPWAGRGAPPAPTGEQIERFLADLSRAVPGLRLRRRDVLGVYAGLVPAAQAGSDRLAVRPTLIDHGRCGGPRGLFSVSGVKFTTARRVAEQTLHLIYARAPRDLRVRPGTQRPRAAGPLDFHSPEAFLRDRSAEMTERLRQVSAEEAVVHLDDLLLRRTDWDAGPAQTRALAEAVGARLGWGRRRGDEEIGGPRRA